MSCKVYRTISICLQQNLILPLMVLLAFSPFLYYWKQKFKNSYTEVISKHGPSFCASLIFVKSLKFKVWHGPNGNNSYFPLETSPKIYVFPKGAAL